MQDEGYDSEKDAAPAAPVMADPIFVSGPSEASRNSSGVSPLPPKANDADTPRSKSHKANVRYRKKRELTRIKQAELNGGLKGVAVKKRKLSALDAISVKTNMAEDFEPSEPAWMNKAEKGKGRDDVRVYGVDELLDDLGFRYVDWAGDKSCPIVDSEDTVIGAICAPPKDSKWPNVIGRAAEVIESARPRLQNIPDKFLDHRRGKFPAIPVGISHGGGQTRPGNLQQRDNNEVLNDVLQDDSVKKVAMLADHYFKAYAPRLHQDYDEALRALSNWSPHIQRNYPGTAFAAASINFGPRTVSLPHYDHANLAWGLCAVSALGSYNPDEGGHLVLWDLKLVIRFPPGSVIIIPSAMIKHSNTPIADGEFRYSIAQYSASGLFRWIDNNFIKDQTWLKRATKAQKEEREAKRRVRWKNGLARLSKLSELR